MTPPVTGPPAPVAAQPPPEPAPLEMSSAELAQWWSRIELARQRRKKESDRWTQLLKGYLPPTNPDDGNVNSNIHFRNGELKKAEIWAQLPELMLSPLEPIQDLVDPTTGQPFAGPDGKPLPPAELAAHVVAIKRQVLNKLLGRDHANVNRTFDEALSDIFTTSAIGATKICYQSDLQPTEVQVPGPPTTMPGAVLGLQDVPGPLVTQTVDVPVYERWRWYRFPTTALGIPHDFHSTDYDEAPFLFMEGVKPLAEAIREFKLDPDFAANATRDDLILEPDGKEPGEGFASLVKFVEVWPKASFCDPTIAHSQLYRHLVLIEGLKQPAVYRASPYQTQGPDGKLTADSMIGNPIHPITVRILPDSAYPKSDAAHTDQLVKLENTWITQDVQLRDANIPRFLYDDAIQEAIDKLKDAATGQGAGVSSEKLQGGIDRLIAALPKLERSQSDIQGHAAIRRAQDETLGLGSNQAGGMNSTVRSATEVATVQANVSVRLKREQNALMECFLRGVRKFDALIARYADETDYVEIEGPTGAKVLAAWNQHTISGRYAYNAKPDSQLTMDAAQDRKTVLDYVNFMAKSPFVNQQEMARVVTLAFGFDPSRMIKQPEPSKPTQPDISFRFVAADLGIPEVRAILAAGGIALPPAISPEAAQAAAIEAAKSLPHGGAADKADVLSKHHGEETGAMPGRTPAAAPPAANQSQMVQ